MSEVELAFRIGVSQRTIQRWLSGDAEPQTHANRLRLSEALAQGSDVSWLYREVAA